MYSALDLAKYIVTKCVRDEKPISNLHLQKILYYIQKSFLKSFDRVAFKDEIEAWQFGPVVPGVYYFFSAYGASDITKTYNTELKNGEYKKEIDRIVTEKREVNPWDMVRDTHKAGKAWDIVFRHGAGNKCVIEIELIRTKG